MKLEFANRMEEFEEGIFQILDQYKNERLKNGKKVFNLSVGTPDFKPTEKVMQAISTAALDPQNYKYSLGDIKELKKALIRRYHERYQVDLNENEMMSVYGSQEGIAHISFTICNPTDMILVPNPGYPIFSIGPSLSGAKAICYELLPENQYLPDLEKISNMLTPDIKLMIVSYPLNPIGKTATVEFYQKLVKWALEHNIILIHDNAYSDIVFDGRKGISILSVPGAKECCVEFYSLSKSFNVTGARIAFLVGNAEIITKFKKFRSQIDYGMFLPIQYGAIEALKEESEIIAIQCALYQERRDALCGGLRSIGWDVEDSEGSMFVWAKIPGNYRSDLEFVIKLIEKSGVICTPGETFGSLGKGFVRFALTLPTQELQKAVEAIDKCAILK